MRIRRVVARVWMMGVLVALAREGPLPQGVAARRLGLDATTLVSIVDDLEYWGLVERRRNRTDRRAYRLTLTAAGTRKLAEVAPFVEAEEWLAPLDEQERAQLQALLKAQADNPGCPDSYDQDGDGAQDATCEGGSRVNGFYGFGIVDALRAVR